MTDPDAKQARTFEDIAHEVAQTIQKEANVQAVFGTPQKLDNKTLIPVAKVSVGAGGGGGGAARGGDGDTGGKAKFLPLGGGGGLSIEVTPLGFICERGDDIVFNPLQPDSEGVLDRVEHLLQSALQRRSP